MKHSWKQANVLPSVCSLINITDTNETNSLKLGTNTIALQASSIYNNMDNVQIC